MGGGEGVCHFLFASVDDKSFQSRSTLKSTNFLPEYGYASTEATSFLQASRPLTGEAKSHWQSCSP